jgi:protein gp37
MGDDSKIEWTDATWNPTVGCTKVSDGCDHCYAERLVEGRMKQRYPHGFGQVVLHPDRLDQPLRWRRPRRVFVNSLSDLFEDQVPDEFIARVFAIMAEAPQHTFQVLTKRPGRMASLLSRPAFVKLVDRAVCDLPDQTTARLREDFLPGWPDTWPLPNVWLGTSVESQKWADVRIPKLLATPAAVRFLSCEPLLGPVTLNPEDVGHAWARAIGLSTRQPKHILAPIEDDDGLWHGHMECVDDCTSDDPYDGRGCGFDTTRSAGIDWVIVGGESGPGARPMHPQWARDLRDQCQAAGVAFFMKQFGAWRYVYEAASFKEEQAARARGDRAFEEHPWQSLEVDGSFVNGPPTQTCATVSRYGGHNGDPAGWPADLRVREYPVSLAGEADP